MKAAVICIVVSLMALLLRKNTPELSLLLTLSAVVAVMAAALSYYDEVRVLLDTLLRHVELDGNLFVPLVKIIAISLITRLGSDVCQDSGQKALASVVEIAGTFCALVTAVPLLGKVLDILLGLG